MSRPAIGFYGVSRMVQYPLPGLDHLVPAVFYCTNNIEIAILKECIAVVIYD